MCVLDGSITLRNLRTVGPITFGVTLMSRSPMLGVVPGPSDQGEPAPGPGTTGPPLPPVERPSATGERLGLRALTAPGIAETSQARRTEQASSSYHKSLTFGSVSRSAC
jgi:hypothetical protein